jgi:flagellar biogenesis protein FliO
MKTDWLLLVASSPAAAGTEATSFEWWRLVILTLIFGVLFGLWWWVNRSKVNFQSLLKSREQLIKIEEQRWLNAHSSIALVQVGEERFLLAQNQHGLAWQKLHSPGAVTSTLSKS